jgi:hypothetical protein
MLQLPSLFASTLSYLPGSQEASKASSAMTTSASYSKIYFDSKPLSELPWSERAQSAILGRTTSYQATGLGKKESQQNALEDYSEELLRDTEALRPGEVPGKIWLSAPGTPEAEDYAYKAIAEKRYPVDPVMAGKQYWEDYMKQVEEWKALQKSHNDPSRS